MSRHKQSIFLIFGKYPRPGRVKTRLIPALGPLGAAEFQRRLTEKTVGEALAAAGRTGASVCFFYSGGNVEKLKNRLDGVVPGAGAVEFYPQEGDSLGDRMKNAFARVLNQAEGPVKVVLFGTDIPDLTAERLTEALHHLDEEDLVIGPSMDGGYWLIAMKSLHDVFTHIPWSTERVLDKTKEIARKKGLSIHLLENLNDMDTPEDLRALAGDNILSGVHPLVSVVIPTLNEAENIEKTIASAASPDAEIIVADGGSTDKTVETAQKAGAVVVRSSRGRAAQQNAGAKAAKGDILLFLHADTRLPAQFDHLIFDALGDNDILGGSFLFKTDFNTLLPGRKYRLKQNIMKLIEKMVNLRTRYLRLPYGDQAIFVRKRVFEKMNGFPEIPIAEDLFFVKNLNGLGKTAVLPAFAVTSARRWITLGILKTTLINFAVAAGCLIGVSPEVLAPLYRITDTPKACGSFLKAKVKTLPTSARKSKP